MIFRDRNLDCRTNGTGALGRARPLPICSSLDIGYGYSRRRRAGPSACAASPSAQCRPSRTCSGSFRAHGPDLRPGRRPRRRRHRRRLRPRRRADRRRSRLCRPARGPGPAAPAAPRPAGPLDPAGERGLPLAATAARAGSASSPENCSGATLILSRHGGWTLWGWPYRFHARMTGAGARMLVTGDWIEGGPLAGLTEPRATGRGPPRLYRPPADRGHAQRRTGAGALMPNPSCRT